MKLSFVLDFQCCYFPNLSCISILIRFSFVSLYVNTVSFYERWTSVCIFETLVSLKGLAKGIKASSKGNMMLVNLSICRKLICSTTNK